jgi:SAM-dependent methyltransferase
MTVRYESPFPQGGIVLNALTTWLDQQLYPKFENNWDDEIFRQRIAGVLTSESTVLDLGAGAGIVQQMNFRGMAKVVHGVDPDRRVEQNPYLDEGRVGVGESIPYEDAMFDVVFADNVLEHLTDPVAVFREVNRVLRPGGYFLAKTPNATHYMPLIARLTPHRFHQYVNRLRGRASVDTFPTCYKANTPSAIEDIAAASGFGVQSVDLIEGRPEYLRMTPLTYLVGFAYERLVNASEVLSHFRILLVATLTKTS